jgi:hypothetical protein
MAVASAQVYESAPHGEFLRSKGPVVEGVAAVRLVGGRVRGFRLR